MSYFDWYMLCQYFPIYFGIKIESNLIKFGWMASLKLPCIKWGRHAKSLNCCILGEKYKFLFQCIGLKTMLKRIGTYSCWYNCENVGKYRKFLINLSHMTTLLVHKSWVLEMIAFPCRCLLAILFTMHNMHANKMFYLKYLIRRTEIF